MSERKKFKERPIVKLLANMEREELEEFTRFTQSPWRKQNMKRLKLLNELKKSNPETWFEQKFERTLLNKVFLNDTSFVALNVALSETKELLMEFFAMQKALQTGETRQLLLLDNPHVREHEKVFEDELKVLDQQLENRSDRSAEYYRLLAIREDLLRNSMLFKTMIKTTQRPILIASSVSR